MKNPPEMSEELLIFLLFPYFIGKSRLPGGTPPPGGGHRSHQMHLLEHILIFCSQGYQLRHGDVPDPFRSF